MKVVAIGRTEILYNSILSVHEKGHIVSLIITGDEAPHYGRSACDFERLANRYGAGFIKTEYIGTDEVISRIHENEPDVAISVNWKTIIPQRVIDYFKHGIINAHAGDLPRYRGNAAPNWALLNNEEGIVLTLHAMTSELDAGPILLQRRYPIKPDTRIGDIYNFIRENYPQMFVEVLDRLETGTVSPRKQPHDSSLSLRCYPRLPRDSEIDWTQSSAQIDRLIRSSSEPFDGAYTFLEGKKLTIWRAHCDIPPCPFLGTPGQVAQRYPATGEVSIITGDRFLVLEEVEIENEGRTTATEVIRSARNRLGMDITKEIAQLNRRMTALERRYSLL